MVANHSIPPFPADIDRDAFGHWLSGFTDGEGTFGLHFHKSKKYPHPSAKFAIALRNDDLHTLELIQSFWQCGRIHIGKWKPTLLRVSGETVACHPMAVFLVANLPSLDNVVIPHFEKFPLRAKKSRDFQIWKEGVKFIYSVSQRKKCGGGHRKWFKHELNHAEHLIETLKNQRQYSAPPLDLPIIPKNNQPLLFAHDD